jgi:ATP-binding cassette subfamily B (MDR/TAP) protein 1
MSLFIISLVFYYAGMLFTVHKLTVGNTLQVVTLLLIGVANSTAMLAMIPQISSSRATATQMLHLASLPPNDSHEARGTLRLASPLPIAMNNLSFTYPNPESKKALDRISLKIESGTCTAIVGPSGGGKSTIASILLGLYPPNESLDLRVAAPLTFNGKSISTCNIANLRSFMSFVPQTPLLFPASIFENIIYGLPENSQYRNFKCAERAASQTGIHTFIESLEQGYNTQIGGGGMGLSGGQAQRINIARALVRRPQVLILDEATSALDGENSEVVREVIKSLTKEGVAVVMITHDVEMMRVADRVIVVENGRIAETGGFDDLTQRDSAFSRLVGMVRQNVGLGLEIEESAASPIEVRKRESWIRKQS